jgi:hypothetical protein
MFVIARRARIFSVTIPIPDLSIPAMYEQFQVFALRQAPSFSDRFRLGLVKRRSTLAALSGRSLYARILCSVESSLLAIIALSTNSIALH